MTNKTPDTVAAIEAVQRLAQSVMDEHSGEEDAQASVYEDMVTAEAPIRWAQTHVCAPLTKAQADSLKIRIAGLVMAVDEAAAAAFSHEAAVEVAKNKAEKLKQYIDQLTETHS